MRLKMRGVIESSEAKEHTFAIHLLGRLRQNDHKLKEGREGRRKGRREEGRPTFA
jgi:hypothetical protein